MTRREEIDEITIRRIDYKTYALTIGRVPVTIQSTDSLPGLPGAYRTIDLLFCCAKGVHGAIANKTTGGESDERPDLR